MAERTDHPGVRPEPEQLDPSASIATGRVKLPGLEASIRAGWTVIGKGPDAMVSVMFGSSRSGLSSNLVCQGQAATAAALRALARDIEDAKPWTAEAPIAPAVPGEPA